MKNNIIKKRQAATPLVSVVIPVYNRPVLLKRALESLLLQTYKNWEAVIVDDGSTDNTALVAKKFIKQDSRFRLIKSFHAGAVKATNKGITLSRGQYLTLLDSDDEYLPEHLAIRVKRMFKPDSPDILYGGFKVVGEHMVPDKNDTAKLISLYNPNVYVGGTFFGRIQVFKKFNGFKQLDYSWDSEFFERAALKYNSAKVRAATYIYHREHQGLVTKKILELAKRDKRTVK